MATTNPCGRLIPALLCLLAACTRAPYEAPPRTDDARILLLLPDQMSGEASQRVALARTAFPSARTATESSWISMPGQRSTDDTLVLIPHAEGLTLDAAPAVDHFLRTGGATIFWGTPCAARQRDTPSGPVDAGSGADAQALRARAGPWPDIQGWALRSEPPGTGDLLRLTQGAPHGWLAAEAVIRSTARWNGLRATCLPTQIQSNEGLLLFARGDARTPRLRIDLYTSDGHQWSSEQPIRSEWTTLSIPFNEFRSIDTFPQQSISGRSIVRIDVGIAHDDPDAPFGPHLLAISDIRVMECDPVPDPTPPRWSADWFAGSPISLSGTLTHVGLTGEPVEDGNCTATVYGVSAMRLDAHGAGRRFSPVAGVRHPAGGSGWCAFVGVESGEGGSTVRSGWIGLTLGGAPAEAVLAVLREVVARMQTTHWLLETDGLGASLCEDELIEIPLLYQPAPDHLSTPIKLHAELIDSSGHRTQPLLVDPPAPGVRVRIPIGRAPVARGSPRNYTVRLRAVESLQSILRDEVQIPLLVLPRGKSDPPGAPVAATGFFQDSGRPLYPLSRAWDHPAGAFRLLEPGHYPASRVPVWLDRMRELGINTVEVTFDQLSQWPQLQHLARELEDRRMYVLLQMPSLIPDRLDMQHSIELAEALADLSPAPVLGIDLTGNRPAPAVESDPDVIAWTAESGLTGRRLSSDLIFRRDADVCARRILALRGVLAMRGLNFPLGVQSDVPLPGLGAAVDFLRLPVDDFRLVHAPDDVAFQFAWARAATDGRPVLPFRSRTAVSVQASEAAWSDQQRFNTRLIEAARIQAAAGIGLGVCTDAALGILRPDGTARPVADPLRAFAHELRGRPARIPPRWQQQRVDTPRTAEAFRTPESWLTNRTEIRPSGFGIETRRLQPVRLIPDASEGPWVELGAAWSRIEVEGKRVERAPAAPVRVPLRSRVKLTVLNTGTATWAPWTPQQDGARLVRIEARSAHEDPVLIRVPRLAAGEEGSTDWTPARPGHHRLRLSMPATGAWGEALDIEVIEPDE